MTEFTTWRSLVDGNEIVAIPDSVVLDYSAETWTQGDSVWEDNNNVADMSIVGSPTKTTLDSGEDAIRTDGTDDYGLITMPSQLEGDDMQQMAIEWRFGGFSSTADPLRAWGVGGESGDTRMFLTLNVDLDFNSDPGNFRFDIRDASDDRIVCSPASNPNINDNNDHDIVIDVVDSTNSDVDVYIDGSSVNLNFSDQQNPSNFGNFSTDMAVWAFNNAGDVSGETQFNMAKMRWHNETIGGGTFD